MRAPTIPLILCGLAAGCLPTQGQTWLDPCDPAELPPCDGPEEACALFDRINCERSVHELSADECDHPLSWNPEAAHAAAAHAAELAEVGGTFRGGWDWQSVTVSFTPDTAMTGMMLGEGETHCAQGASLHCNIMHCRVIELGVGTVAGTFQGNDHYTYYVMNFVEGMP